MQKKAQLISYTDRPSTLFLWWKAVLLAPIWSLPLLPLVGGISGLFGNFVNQVVYTGVLIYLFAYFVEDLLKTKIRADDETMSFGYRFFHLKELVSIGLLYKRNRSLPSSLVFTFQSGKKLKLHFSRMQASDVEQLIRNIELRYPDVKIDPVVRTLARCKKQVKTVSVDTSEQVEIPYHSHRLFNQLAETFMNTASNWIRVGPVLAAIFCAPAWLAFYSNLFAFFSWQRTNELLLKKALEQHLSDLDGAIVKEAGDISNGLVTLASHPVALFFLVATLITVVCYLLKVLLRPNFLMLQPSGLLQQLRIGSFVGTVHRADWDDVTNLSLVKGKNSSDSESWKIQFHTKNDKTFALSLSAIAGDNRTRMLKAIQRLAPNIGIDPELAEALMPKQQRSYTELWLQSLAAPPERKNLEPLTPGQFLYEGKYEVVKRLGVGGQGMAYLCLETQEDGGKREIVLKETILPVFVENTVKQQALDRFQQEATMLERLKNPGIVELIDYFIEDHRGYLVLEHIDGVTLRQAIEENGAFSREQVQNLALDMCRILTYLHQQNVIHRDFTPDNLMLTRQGKLKLIDFNVAQNVQTGSTGTIVGKHAFLPPEQFRGKPTERSDIYAMGATLFFIACGKDPEPITESHPLAQNADVCAEFDEFVGRCTKMDQTKRFESAQEALNAMNHIFNSEDEQESHVIRVEEKTKA